MLLGKIQSGKTKTFLGAVALAFDNGFDVAIILTKGTRALTKQTLERVRREFAAFTNQDQLQVFDIMTIPGTLTGYELSQKLIFVAKKQVDNMERLTKLFRETYPQLSEKRVLIIDDEADYASIGFKRSKEEGLEINRTSRQIENLRNVLSRSAFLQVTATPYSLYLQPEDPSWRGMSLIQRALLPRRLSDPKSGIQQDEHLLTVLRYVYRKKKRGQATYSCGKAGSRVFRFNKTSIY